MHQRSSASVRPIRRFWPRAWLRLLIARLFFQRIPHGRLLGLRVLGAPHMLVTAASAVSAIRTRSFVTATMLGFLPAITLASMAGSAI